MRYECRCPTCTELRNRAIAFVYRMRIRAHLAGYALMLDRLDARAPYRMRTFSGYVR